METPDSTNATEGRTGAWYIMEVRHRNAVIGIAKQYLIDGEPERALAILRQVQNGIGDAAAAKIPKQTEQASDDLREKLKDWADRPRFFGDRYVREGYDIAVDDVRRILNDEIPQIQFGDMPP